MTILDEPGSVSKSSTDHRIRYSIREKETPRLTSTHSKNAVHIEFRDTIECQWPDRVELSTSSKQPTIHHIRQRTGDGVGYIDAKF